MFLVDTDVANAIIKDVKLIGNARHILSESVWGISSITLMEITYGRELLEKHDKRRELISRFLSYCKVFDFDARAAHEGALVRSQLRRIGKPIGAYDPLIAGHAISLGAVLVTANFKHFSKVKNLEIVNWLK